MRGELYVSSKVLNSQLLTTSMTVRPPNRTPAQSAVGRRWIVFGRQDEHVVPRRLLASELERVDLRSGPVARKKIMNGVEDSHAGYRPASRSAASCSLRWTHSATPGVAGASRRASPHMRAAEW